MDVDIVPSCYDDEQKVALVEFNNTTPSFLSVPEEYQPGVRRIKLDDTDITFDEHFSGFTQLYVPSTDKLISAEYVPVL